jgi:hypothetical protein
VKKYAERKNGIGSRSRMRLEIVTNESLRCLPCLNVKDVRRSLRFVRHHGEGANFRHSEAGEEGILRAGEMTEGYAAAQSI